MDTMLPGGVRPYKRTPVFDEKSIPAGLRREHRTKPGVWALIQVVEGRLRYRTLDEPREDRVLSPGDPGVVRPEQRHEVEPLGAVRFFVEFYAQEAPAGSPHEGADPLP